MPIPTVLGARMAHEPEGKNVGQRLTAAVSGPPCGQKMRTLEGSEHVCSREDGHDGLCVEHDGNGNAVAVSRWARRR